ncbi:hypothetical protein [Prescottella equi]|nr:hypothetical protein [Prescottella equi]
MSVSFLQATTSFLQNLVDAVFTGSVTPGFVGLFGSLDDVVSGS